MKCEFDYCIYNSDYFCTLNEIEVNAWGMCDCCILVSISKEELELLKEGTAHIRTNFI